jgi:NAD(P)-dependent dehydrogenase (short-subunit alcohol dehydrogenase family)
MTGVHAGRHAERVALVTGGSDGIGLAIARALLADGHTVVLSARGAAKLDAARRAFATEGVDPARVHVVPMDVGDEASVARGLIALKALAPRIHVLVNNAGLVPAPEPFLSGSLDLLERSIRVNAIGAARLCRALVPAMIEDGWGRVVNTASSAGLSAPPGLLAYSVGKATLVALTKSIAVEVADSGVTVNAVAPSAIRTDSYLAEKGEDACRNRSRSIPSGRLGRAEDVAAVVAFLCTDEARHVTGQVIPVDGGETAAGQYTTLVVAKRTAR